MMSENQSIEKRVLDMDATALLQAYQNREIKDMLGSNGIFLVPVYPAPAKKHGLIYRDIFAPGNPCKRKKPFEGKLPFISLANTFGLPALVVPCGKSGDGLPIGLQVVSAIGNEALIFRVGAFLESHFGGYQRNTLYDWTLQTFTRKWFSMIEVILVMNNETKKQGKRQNPRA